MKSKIKYLALLLAVSLCSINTVTTFATNSSSNENLLSSKNEVMAETQETEVLTTKTNNGWVHDGEQKYYYVNGEKIQNCTYFIDGTWYLFNSYGELVYNDELFVAKGNSEEWGHFRSTSDGSLVLGWYSDGSNRFYYDKEDGHRYTNQIFKFAASSYYVNSEGKLITSSWCIYNGKIYWADAFGILTKKVPNDGWVYADGSSYYCKNGVLLVGELCEIDGDYYFFDYSGKMTTGSFYYYDKENNKEGYKLADENGHVFTNGQGWQLLGENYYYFEETGWLAYDKFLTISGEEYYFDSVGRMATGSFYYYDKENNKEGYKLADENGHVFTNGQGWQLLGENYYYFEETGWLAFNKFLTISGEEYYFNQYCILQTGLFNLYSEETDTKFTYITKDNGAIYPECKTGGWVQHKTEQYYFKSPYTLASLEFLDINGKTYYFTPYMAQGFFWVNGNEYCTDNNGVVYKNQWFLHYNLFWLYAQKDGTLCKNGIYEIDGKKYFFDKYGFMKIGLIIDPNSNDTYLSDTSGAIITTEGWTQYNSNWYYINSKGKVVLSQWITVDSNWYYLNSDGTMATDWVAINGHWYYMDQWGAMQTGWVAINGHWYYMDQWGAMQTGWVAINGHWYYMDQWGTMQIGWVTVDGHWYYMDQWGTMQIGWVAINGHWYYMDQWGTMQTGWIVVDGYWYYLNSDGTMATSQWIGDYYVQTDGSMATSQWIGEYYVDASGKWVKNV